MSASSSPAPAMSSPRAAVSGAPDPRREGGKGGTPPPPAPAALAGDSPLSPPPPSGGEGGEAPCHFAVRRCITRRTNKCYLALARHPRSRGALTPCRAAETTQIQIRYKYTYKYKPGTGPRFQAVQLPRYKSGSLHHAKQLNPSSERVYKHMDTVHHSQCFVSKINNPPMHDNALPITALH